MRFFMDINHSNNQDGEPYLYPNNPIHLTFPSDCRLLPIYSYSSSVLYFFYSDNNQN